VRAGIVATPELYRWSSFRALAEGAHDALVDFHPLYLGLAATPAERQSAYRALFGEALDGDFIDGLRAATNGGWAFGYDRFKRDIAQAAGRRTTPLPAGRKAKAKDAARQEILL